MVDGDTMYFEFRGSSMRPTLKPGDKLFVASGGDVRVGDVVVFRLDEKLHIAHRVVSVDSRGIITRGDNAHSHDARILQPYDILGNAFGNTPIRQMFLVDGRKRPAQRLHCRHLVQKCHK